MESICSSVISGRSSQGVCLQVRVYELNKASFYGGLSLIIFRVLSQVLELLGHSSSPHICPASIYIHLSLPLLCTLLPPWTILEAQQIFIIPRKAIQIPKSISLDMENEPIFSVTTFSFLLGPSAHKILLEPFEHLWQVWGLILNAISPLLLSSAMKLKDACNLGKKL